MAHPKVLIGMPVYQGERYVGRAIRSIMEQDYSEWRLLVSDNASSDGTAEIVRHLAAQDCRISYVRQSKNVGATANFSYLVRQADLQYFMWAAADDEWSPSYVSLVVGALESNEWAAFSSGSVMVIDDQSTELYAVPPLPKLSGTSPAARVLRFLWEREADGKANAIYSVFRTPLVADICKDDSIWAGWGADISLVAGALARGRYLQVRDAVYRKRIAPDGGETARKLKEGAYDSLEYRGNFPLPHSRSYIKALSAAMPTFWLKALVIVVMLSRTVRVAAQVSAFRAARFWQRTR